MPHVCDAGVAHPLLPCLLKYACCMMLRILRAADMQLWKLSGLEKYHMIASMREMKDIFLHTYCGTPNAARHESAIVAPAIMVCMM